ncbi:YrzI family small protein [Evansella halocellulosilytica]|nr:YrzI family small protein [Evansella halocellulosilytica]
MVINLLFFTITITKRQVTEKDIRHAQHETMQRERRLMLQAKQSEYVRML